MGRHGTIAGRKAAQDAKRSANFTKYARVITIAARAGGDPEYNVSLKHAIDRAKRINMPNDKIDRAIKKGTGELEGETYVEGSFEGYGPGGVAVIVNVLTDNNNRTTAFAGSPRRHFAKVLCRLVCYQRYRILLTSAFLYDSALNFSAVYVITGQCPAPFFLPVSFSVSFFIRSHCVFRHSVV